MRILVVLGHPNPASFNHAIAQMTLGALEICGHEIIFHDLHQEGFDPLLPADEIPEDGIVDPVIEQHCHELATADGIVIIHPNWWGQPPAMLKGWIDRVFRPGVAYRFLEGDSGEGVPEGLLKAQVALVFNTSNTGAEREADVFGDPLESLWRNCIFDLCGVTTVYRRVFRIVVTSTPEQRLAWLSEVENTVARFFPPDERNNGIK
jgi:NAD(P)H dehydrogenase (quinone)